MIKSIIPDIKTINNLIYVILDTTALQQAFGVNDSSFVLGEYSFQWYRDGVAIPGATKNKYVPDEDAVEITNAKEETVVRCELTIDSVTGDDNDATYSFADAVDKTVNNKLTYEYIYKYTGPSASSIEAGAYKMKDFFEGVEDVKDETKTYRYYDDFSPYLSVSKLDRVGSYTSFSYQWNVYSVDGDKAEVSSDTKALSIEGVDGYKSYEFNGTKKMVACYECVVDMYYGDSKLASVTKKFTYQYNPLYIKTSEGATIDGKANPVSVRQDGKQTFRVDVDVADTEVIEGVTYQWYSIKDGEETKLDGETTNTLKAKITDYSVSYKCIVKAKVRDGYPEVKYSTERVFTTTTNAGYFVKNISERQSLASIGDTVKLAIDARTDKDYSLRYQWQKLSYAQNGSVATETVGQEASLTVALQKEEDFDRVTGNVRDENGSNIMYVSGANYFLTVDVLDKDGKVYATYHYDFGISEDKEIEVESNEGPIELTRGDDAELYVKTEPKKGFQIVKTWYKVLAKAAYSGSTWNAQSQKYEYSYLDSDFEEPAADYIENSYEDTEDFGYTSVRIFYQKITVTGDGTTCLLQGKNGSTFNDDILGEYACRVALYRDTVEDVTAEDAQTESVEWCKYTVKYVSELNAHAKNSIVKAVPGGSAKLQVVAGNVNETVYPITYSWEKRNVETGQYEKIEGAKDPVLKLEDIQEEDYTQYRVTIEDVAHGGELNNDEALVIDFTLMKKAVEIISFTPEYSYFNKAVGDKVTLKADAQITQGTKVFYEWYRQEHMAYEYGYGQTTREWEILNQDTDTYSFTIASEDDYTSYKCVATFNTTDEDGNSVSETHTYIFEVEPEYSFDLERLTPEKQYKKVGDSATYSVRLVTDNPAIDEKKVTYEWYYYDENGDRVDIENAKGATYTMSKLQPENFGVLYCNASYVLNEEEEQTVNSFVSFKTYVYTDASLDKNDEIVRVELGSDVTLAPVINNSQGKKLTYQWYRDIESKEIIHGATSQQYTIKEIGEDELLTYVCEISCDGALMATYNVTVEEDVDPSRIHVEVADGYESEVKAVLGQSAAFAVTAKSNKNLDLKYQWYHKTDSSRKAIGGATAATYKIDKVTLGNLGQYICQVTDTKGRKAELSFTLRRTTGFQAENNTYSYDVYEDLSSYVGYQTTFGGTVTLSATATISSEYTLFYQWWKYDKEEEVWERIYGATQSTLTIAGATEEDLGSYRCQVSSPASGEYEKLYYLVYVDTGLVAVPSAKNVLVQADGTVRMYVSAKANDGENITYKWSKQKEEEEEDEWNDDYTGPTPIPTETPEEEDDGYETITGATSESLILPQLTKADYGVYRCIVSTRGQEYTFTFDLSPHYEVEMDRDYAQQGDAVNLTAEIINPAVDSVYTYTWYAENPVTGTLHRADGATTAQYTTTAPKIAQSRWSDGYEPVDYRCVIRDASETEEDDKGEMLASQSDTLRVLPDITYGANLPETNHPNDKTWDIQAYKIDGAEALKITMECNLGTARLTMIDKFGHAKTYTNDELEEKYTEAEMLEDMYKKEDEKNDTYTYKFYVKGDRVIFLMNGNTSADYYGYKVTSIEKVAKKGVDAGVSTVATSAAASGSAVKKLPAKGKKVTSKNVIYKVTKSDKKKGTVAAVGVKASKKKKITSLKIADTVKINGYKFKVTAVSKNAVKGCAKLKKVTVGKNVTSIGANAFAGNTNLTSVTLGKSVKKIGAGAFSGDKKLTKITIKATKLKSVGKKAFTKVPKKAVVSVPKKQKKAYKKLFKKAGFKGKVK